MLEKYQKSSYHQFFSKKEYFSKKPVYSDYF